MSTDPNIPNSLEFTIRVRCIPDEELFKDEDERVGLVDRDALAEHIVDELDNEAIQPEGWSVEVIDGPKEMT